MTFTPNSPESPKARIEGEILCARTFPLTIEIIDYNPSLYLRSLFSTLTTISKVLVSGSEIGEM